jgi:hypothetical protein
MKMFNQQGRNWIRSTCKAVKAHACSVAITALTKRGYFAKRRR